eukprot:9035275-Alexandrium_andersonii.AAC.1
MSFGCNSTIMLIEAAQLGLHGYAGRAVMASLRVREYCGSEFVDLRDFATSGPPDPRCRWQ